MIYSLVYREGSMMRKVFAFLMVFLLVLCSFTLHSTISQKRFPNETFQQALNRVKEHSPLNKNTLPLVKDTPLGKKVLVKDIDFSMVPALLTYQELEHMFHVIRDSRFLYVNETPDFSRRISWLYPDDGCFARAALSGVKLNDEALVRPIKIFAFGTLEVQTPYASSGSVSWWYHVASVVSYMGAYYVLDPALNAQAPLLVEDWFNLMSTNTNLKGVVCNAYAYDPFDDCFKATAKSEQHAQKDQLKYLVKEWHRMNYLGLDPVKLLGENPPWILEPYYL
jgi:hypothetical protein